MPTPGEFFFAWVTGPVAFNEATHAIKDEKIIWFSRSLVENDRPTCSIITMKPSSELLAPGRHRWAWISYRKLNGTIVPLFLGWMVGLPEDISENTITLAFQAVPLDLAEQKVALANTLKVLPQYDEAFIKPEEREDPDHALQAIPKVWHINHLFPLTVTVSHLINGEDGHIVYTSGTQVVKESVKRTIRSVPLRRVKLTATGFWIQSASGEVDLKVSLLQAAKAAGTTADGVVTSYTGQGLADDTPKNDDRIGSGWFVKEASMQFVKQEPKVVALAGIPIEWSFHGYATDPMLNYLKSLTTIPGDAVFYLWHLIPNFIAKYEVNRRREEQIVVHIRGDVQPVFSEPSDEQVLFLTATANNLNELIDEGGTLAPIRDSKARAYFTTARGKQSLEFLMGVAARPIIERARCAQVEFKVPFEDGIDATCRMTAELVDSRFPGGAIGKIIGSTLLADPNAGEWTCTLLIACTIGEGNTVTAMTGEALYIDDEYIDEDYYERDGETWAVLDGNLVYSDFYVPPNDDGTDFSDMSRQHVVESCILVNGETAQEAVLDNPVGGVYPDIEQAVDALVEVYSEYQLILRPLEVPIEPTKYTVTVTGLMIPKTIDLRAVGP